MLIYRRTYTAKCRNIGSRAETRSNANGLYKPVCGLLRGFLINSTAKKRRHNTMKDFIEVTDQYQNKRLFLPVNRICFIKERGDGCAIINFEMTATNRECTGLIEMISDVTTVESYGNVIAQIKK